jgi:thiamine-phosphate pyrophosphorylase
MIDPFSWNVYLVTDRRLSRGRSTEEVVRRAVAGGVSAVQLREKELDTKRFYEEGIGIRALLKSAGIPLIINDRIDIALALDADGVHLGQSDMPPEAARAILGPDKIIGLSIERPEDLREEELRCVDYLGVSPVFLTSTKHELRSAWGLDGLRKLRSATNLPLAAIGSVNGENARQVIEAGADLVAVVSAIVSADHPEEAAAQLVAEVKAGKLGRSR